MPRNCATFCPCVRSAAVPVSHAIACAIVALFALFAGCQDVQAGQLHETFNAHARHGSAKADHSAWDKILARHVRAGEDGLNRVDYAALKRNGRGALQAYIAHLETVDPARLTVKEQFAFWVNLYNAKTVEIVADHYPVKSIRKIRLGFNPLSGPWKAKVVKVAGAKLSLDDIEHRILRPVWKDPRIHYAVNCASVGCPNLALRAYTGARLEKMLEGAARAYVNNSRGVHVSGGRISISSLYDWYADDFGKNRSEILAHIAKYAKPPLAARLRKADRIDDYHYDWMLNDAK